MNSLAELVRAYQTDTLKLPALFEALAARGALPEDEHQAEITWLEQQRSEGDLESLIIKALLAKLAIVQSQGVPAEPVTPEHDADVTMVKPATQRPSVPPTMPDDDVTRVQPTARSAPAPADLDEVTHYGAPPQAGSGVLTRAVGAEEQLFVDWVVASNRPGTEFVLCSDGINKEMSDAELDDECRRNPHPQDLIVSLFELAMSRAGRDNISAVAVRIQE